MNGQTYYVYALVDPRDGLEFYIGKGKGKRAYFHTNELKAGKQTDNPYKDAVIRQLLESGLEPVVRFVATNLTEDRAYELEKYMIRVCGRRVFDVDGILTNLTEGGAAPPPQWGKKPPKERIAAFVERCKGSMKGKKHSAETRRRMSEWQIGKQHSEKTKAKIGAKSARSDLEKYGPERAAEIAEKKRRTWLEKRRLKDEPPHRPA